MKVWIFNPYGNLPGEGWSPYRTTSIANALTARGHEVVWWVSSFEHRSKRQRTCKNARVEFGNGYSARILHTRTYQSHISLSRVRYERSYAHGLLRAIKHESERPDLIIHGEPAVCFSDISIQAARICCVPLIIDVIDTWPELFALALPRPLRRFQNAIFAPLYARRRRFLRESDGFLAVARNYLSLAQSIAPGKPGQVAYLGTDTSAFRFGVADLPEKIRRLVPEKRPGETWCIYVGTLGKNYDIPTVIAAAEKLRGSGVRLLIAGDGDCREQVEYAAANVARGVIHYLGRLSFEELCGLYPSCDVALACYAGASTVSMPFKAFDYLAAGLPIVTSLSGDLGDFVVSHGIGEKYESENVMSLCSAVEKLASEPALRLAYGKNAKKLGLEMDYGVQYSRAADFIEGVARSKSVPHIR